MSIPIALLLTVGLFGCAGSKSESTEQTSLKKSYDQTDDATDSQLKSSDGFVSVAVRDDVELLVNGKTAEISVMNHRTGKTWYSNPQNAGDDISSTVIEQLRSQVSINYVDDTAKAFEKSSYVDAVANGQYAFYPLENGIRVNYIIGIRPKTWCVPDVLTKERFERILTRLDDTDRMTLQLFYQFMSHASMSEADIALQASKYPIIKTTDIYILSTNGVVGKENMSDMLMQMVEPLFAKAGYTAEDLKADNKASGITMTEAKDTSVTLSVEYMLENNELVVSIPKDSIAYNGNNLTLTDISLMPYFGSDTHAQDGYIFIPDGSGAIMNLFQENSRMNNYSKRVYGQDNTISPVTSDQGDGSQIYFPVYGIAIKDQAFLAVIEQGDAAAFLTANVRNQLNACAYVYPKFRIRQSSVETTSRLNVAGQQIYQKKPLQSDLTIRYLFTNGDQANYSGMAAAYRRYLQTNGGLPQTAQTANYPMFINLLGAVSYNTTVLGIPVEDEKPLTTYQQAQTILEQLEQKGIAEPALSYTGWQKGGMENAVATEVRPESNLGGKSAFTGLCNWLKQKNIAFFPEVDFAYVSREGYGFNKNRQAAKNLSDMTAFLYEYDLSLLEQKSDPLSTIVSPSAYAELAQQYRSSSGQWGLSGVGLQNLGNSLNSDFRKDNMIDRQQVKTLVTAMMKQLAGQSESLMVNGGNAYTLANTSLVTGLSLTSGNNYLFDESVPFNALVMHGTVAYTSEPLNQSNDYETEYLRLAETGCIPSFEWMYADNSALKETDCRFYSMHYGAWVDKAAALKQLWTDILSPCHDAVMISHNRIGEVTVTKYDNGLTIYVNYGDQIAQLDETSVEPRNYLVKKGEMSDDKT